MEFNAAYWRSMQAAGSRLERFFLRMTEADRQAFIYAFFPFMFGICPYTAVTEKRREALRLAHADYVCMSIGDITRSIVLKLLQGFE